MSELISEVKQATFFSVMADEVTSHNKEILAFCIRFVDADSNIREEFISFSEVQRITGRYLAAEIKSIIEDKGLEMRNIRGQTYDGAASMASNVAGVQAQIKVDAPKATFVHCSSHCLNLVIAHSCSVQNVRTVIDKVKATSLFFEHSAKRTGLLKEIAGRKLPENRRKKPLIDLCGTRWAARHDAYSHFHASFGSLIETFEVIAHKMHADRYDFVADIYPDWDGHSRSDASSLLHAITDFSFIVTFLVIYKWLSFLAGITVKLQSSHLDILEAYAMVNIRNYLDL